MGLKPTPLRRIRFISWFSGLGGFELALDPRHFECVGACEINPFSRRVYTHRLGAPAWFPEDITKVKAQDIPKADLWVAGSPCTDVSVAGARAGIARTTKTRKGTRSGLVHTLLDLAAKVKPEGFLWENVPGFLTGETDGVAWMADFLGAVSEVWPAFAWRTLDSKFFGVPQRRRRVFLVAGAGPWDPADALLSEREGVLGSDATGGTTRDVPAAGAGSGHEGHRRQCTSVITGSIARPRGDGLDTFIVEEALNGKTQPLAFEAKRTASVFSSVVPTLRAAGFTASHANAGAPPAVLLPEQEIEFSGKPLCFSPKTSPHFWGDLKKGPSALTASTPLAALVGGRVRYLMPVEAERLQGLPDGWTCLCGAADRYRGLLAQARVTGVSQETLARSLVAAARQLRGPNGKTPLPEGFWERCQEALGDAKSTRATSSAHDLSERLEGLSWLCACPDGPRYEAIGNGLAVPCVSWIGDRLATIMRPRQRRT